MIVMRVFLSYAQPDQALAKLLAKELKAEGIDVWVDFQELLPGDNWPLEIGRAMESCDAIVFLMTRSSVESDLFRSEIAFALTGRRFKGRLIPVAMSSDILDSDRIAWILRELYWVIAPDIREAASQIKAALLPARVG